MARECVELGGITPVPCCPPFILGNMNFRGHILTLIDICSVLKLPIHNASAPSKVLVVQAEGLFVGLLANEVVDLIHLNPSDLMSTPVQAESRGQGYFKGTASFHGKTLNILDMSKILLSEVLTVDESLLRRQDGYQESAYTSMHSQMKVGDKELCQLFQTESREYLQHLNEGFLQLERNPTDFAVLEVVCREAHSLKSSARMLGANKIEEVAHRFEDILCSAKREQIVLTPSLIDRLRRGLDLIEKLIDEVITGISAGVDVLGILNELREELSSVEDWASKEPKNRKSQAPGRKKSKANSVRGIKESGEVEKVPLSTAISERLSLLSRVESIRVDPCKVDALMAQASELSNTTIGMKQHLMEISRLTTVCEEWRNRILEYWSIVKDISKTAHNGEMQKLVRFHEQEREHAASIAELVDHLAKAACEHHQRLDLIAQKLEKGIQAVRLLPLSTVFQFLPKLVGDMGHELSKEMSFVIEGDDIVVDKQIIEEMKDPLIHIIRNAMDHGIETPAERIQIGKPHVGSLRVEA